MARARAKTSDVISALEFVIANKSKLNAQIINLSLGHPIYAPAADDPLVQAVQKATAAGLIVVTSAGNNGVNETTGLPGYGGVSSPCNAPSAICVGAANTQNTVKRSDDVVAPYSGRGPSWYDGFAKPDVVAPGHKLASDTSTSSYLYTTLPASRVTSKNGQPLLMLSGTSMAPASRAASRRSSSTRTIATAFTDRRRSPRTWSKRFSSIRRFPFRARTP